ncbi:glycosyl-4,4'-diaponeurosporenoate acyltransferase CrtO family protein [Pedobacter terrae]
MFRNCCLLQSKFKSAGIIMFLNVMMNLYPSLLQQENKRQIDRFINKF